MQDRYWDRYCHPRCHFLHQSSPLPPGIAKLDIFFRSGQAPWNHDWYCYWGWTAIIVMIFCLSFYYFKFFGSSIFFAQLPICDPWKSWVYSGVLQHLGQNYYHWRLTTIFTGAYGCLSMGPFYKCRSEMNELLSSYQNLNSNRCARLMCFCVCDLLVGIPSLRPFWPLISRCARFLNRLQSEHRYFSEVVQIPAVVWRATAISESENVLYRWICVYCTFVFAIFGFNKESRNKYRSVLQSVIRVASEPSWWYQESRPALAVRLSVLYLLLLFPFWPDMQNFVFKITFKAAT